MKSKPAVYLLGFLVLCIWGMVVYRLFAAVHDEDDGPGQQSPAGKIKKTAVPKLYPDTFKLVLNYPDPFTGAAARMPDTVGVKKVKKEVQPLVVPPVQVINPIEQMKYLGFVSDGKGSRLVAVMSYQGAEKILKEKDTLKGVKIMSIKKNGVTVMYRGKTSLIKTE